MIENQQPRTAAQQVHETACAQWNHSDSKRGLIHASADMAASAFNRAEEINADLGAQIAELRDTVAAQTTLMNSRYNAQAAMIVSLKDRLAALESPASAPESVKSVFPRTYYVGVEKEPESAPEPDPLCQCGHPKSEHFNRKPLVCCKWDYCCCEEFVPQASPATAHQEPPDAVRYYTIVLTNEQLPALNDCIFEGIANAEVEDVAAIGDSGLVVVDRAPATLTFEEAQTLREWFDDPSELADKLKRHGLMIVRVSDLDPLP